jgi:ferrous-iron efflux pump FieF
MKSISTAKLLRIVSFAVIFINLILIVSKAVLYKTTHSVAMFSSLFDSAFDLIISSINSAILFYASKPKDDNHRFGHSAIEDVVSLFQVLLIAGTGILVFYSAITLKADSYNFSWFAIFMMVLNAIPLLGIILLQSYAQKKSASTIVKTDLLHYSSDFISMAGVVIAMILTHYTSILWFDIACGGVIMLVIFHSCFGCAKQAFDNLMAKELQDGTAEKVLEILQNANQIVGFKNIRTRGSGQMKFIQFDIILKSDICLKNAHDIAHILEDKIHESIQNADVIIHMEPM